MNIKSPEKTPSDVDPAPPNFVVGIGASAGGLEALELLFESLPTDLGMSYVVVQHLSPDFDSLMDELLARQTAMPIQQAEHGQVLCANTIYLLPPKKEIAISNWRLVLKDRDAKDGLTFPIDSFFRSLAQDVAKQAVAIVLSGTGSDGSRGICDIHEHGGLVIVQDEDSAKFNGMPRSSADSGIADLILPPGKIGEALAKYLEQPHPSGLAEQLLSPHMHEKGLARVAALIRDRYGLNLTSYKQNTIVRRTERRIVLNRLAHVEEYSQLLEDDHEELDCLYRDLLIGVTRFFRDTAAFLSLRQILQQRVEEAPANSELRVWAAGCSTGQEAYSLAMLIDDILSTQTKLVSVKLFATDLDAHALDFAKEGIYTQNDMVDLLDGYQERYFKKIGDRYHITANIRQIIVFAQHNILRDAPFTNMDLIVCRNMLIYMQPNPQRKILSLFHFGLRANGLLFLGPSETTSEITEEFEPIDNRWRIYRKRRDVRLPADFRVDLQPIASNCFSPTSQNAFSSPEAGISRRMYDAVLDQIMPPSFLVSNEGELLHTFSDAGDLLRRETGRHSSLLSERIIDPLRSAVTTGLRKALQDAEVVRFGSIEISRQSDGKSRQVNLTITPIVDDGEARTMVVQVSQSERESRDQTQAGDIPKEHIEALEAELRIVKQSLQSTIEELETSNEELQATNEEMLASNEELQSTNEELHSVNEELYTVNAEHQSKITQLSEVTRDMDNLLYSTEVHTIFLDRDLQIRKFTPKVAETFSLIPQDIGRRIDSFTSSIDCQDLSAKLERVIATSEPHEEEVCDNSGVWFLMRLLPYHSTEQEEREGREAEGALLTLINISKLRATSLALEDSVRKRDQFLAMLSHELRNPLGTIVNASQVMGKQPLPESAVESLGVIRRQTQHMAILLDDLLDVTRVSQGKIHLQKRIFDLQRAITGAVESVRARCEAREQLVNVRVPEGPVWIEGSEPRILQVLSNLLTNASKYSAPGEDIDVTLLLEEVSASVIVRDYGVGVPKDQLDSIFELFVQSDDTLDRSDGGLGIGLTLAKSLIELHGGRISVRSEGDGRGSEFEITLPLSSPPPQTEESTENYSGLTELANRVVLVEDNMDATKMLSFLLEDAGFHVSIAHDGREGLKLIRSFRPDTAIIDIGLPELNGYELAQRIREYPELEGIRLIALTGYGQASDREEALAAGFDEHVVKPIDPNYLGRLLGQPKSAS